jgi:asparagine synthase (glutamine-hydrolysing)
MLADSLLYLPDDILMKVDRAAMAVGLETRAPLLDHSVYEFAWRIPHERKVSMQAGKLPLRTLLSRYLPAGLLEPRKRGFDVPLDRWLRGPLRDWAESRLSPDALARTGVLDVRQVRAAWTAHLSGEVDVAEQLWVLLSLQGFLLAR